MKNFVDDWIQARHQKAQDWHQLTEAKASDQVVDYFEWCVARHQDALAVLDVTRPQESCSYRQLRCAALAVARRLKNHWPQEVKAGECVGLLMENGLPFLVWTLGLAYAGITVAWIPTPWAQSSESIDWALELSQARLLIVSRPLRESGSCDSTRVPVHVSDSQDIDVKEEIQDWEDEILQWSTERRRDLKPRDPFVYIYTSGTTGRSKAAKFSHRRWIGCGLTWARPGLLESGKGYYIALPMYHGNAGAVAMSAIFFAGSFAVIRDKFSVSAFFRDIRQYQCKYTIYVGEIWRYLYNAVQSGQLQPDVYAQSGLKVIIGNGLRADIWTKVMDLFGIERVVEHYGSTEMPGDAVIQWFNRPGSCGFVPIEHMSSYAGVLIQFDQVAGMPVRKTQTPTAQNEARGNKGGWAIQCGVNEPGELIMPLPEGKYDGYVDSSQTEKKLYRNVFIEGDVWYSSGDILKYDQDGFFYFIDRTGDTFRWKGENVATTEVEQQLNQVAGILEANVYGVVVSGYDGKAGMASLLVDSSQIVDMDAVLSRIAQRVDDTLPKYARPLFLRIKTKEANATTSTFKFQKHAYCQQGFDPSAVGSDQLFVRDRDVYVPITAEMNRKIQAGQCRF